MAATAHPATTYTVLEELRRTQRADGPAAVLAIVTATPAYGVGQDEFADWFFRVTKSEHLTTLKAKMKRICDKSGIRKRHFHHTEETIAAHPELVDPAAPSLGARLGASEGAVAGLAAAAAARAVAEWGRPAADVTHLVVATNAGGGEPGADLRVAALLGLRPAARRTLLCLHGCSAGAAALRVAADIAENHRGARVLVACAQAALLSFRGPDGDGSLVPGALFGDGAGAAVVGAGPAGPGEHPVFRIVSAAQATLPGTERAVALCLGEGGLSFGSMSAEVPALVRGSIERCVADALEPLAAAGVVNAGAAGIGGWNGFFWAVHPGGRAMLDSYKAALGLGTGKLAASRCVLSEYGNMFGATVFFVLDEIRRRRCLGQGAEEEGEDCEWGIMSVIGAGLTVETMVLHAAGSRESD